MDINDINGYEIINFLNEVLGDKDDSDELCDVSICCDLKFIKQDILNNTNSYELHFTGYFNNWGTMQLIDDNRVIINSDGEVNFWLSEPFDGDGSAGALSEVLKTWLSTHEFNSNVGEAWMSTMRDIYEQLPQIGFDDPDGIQEQIDKLIEAKSFMK